MAAPSASQPAVTAPPPSSGYRAPFDLRKEGFEKADLGPEVKVEVHAANLHEIRKSVRAAFHRRGFEMPEVTSPHLSSLLGERELILDGSGTAASARKALLCYVLGAGVFVGALLWTRGSFSDQYKDVWTLAAIFAGGLVGTGFAFFQFVVYFRSEVVQAMIAQGAGDTWTVSLAGGLVRSRNMQAKGGHAWRDYVSTIGKGDSGDLSKSIASDREASSPLV